jgi:hypothetical protein
MNRMIQWSMVVLTAVFFQATSVRAAGDPGAICASAKQKAAGKKAADKLKCHSKGTAHNAPADPDCLTKAEMKFEMAFAMAEAKGGCAVTGDAAAIEAQVDNFVSTVVASTPISTTTTTTLPCNNGAGAIVAGVCWFLGVSEQSCTQTCAAQGRPYNDATRDFAGSNGSDANCSEVAIALGGAAAAGHGNLTGVGCYATGGGTIRDTTATTAGATFTQAARYCACE